MFYSWFQICTFKFIFANISAIIITHALCFLTAYCLQIVNKKQSSPRLFLKWTFSTIIIVDQTFRHVGNKSFHLQLRSKILPTQSLPIAKFASKIRSVARLFKAPVKGSGTQTFRETCPELEQVFLSFSSHQKKKKKTRAEKKHCRNKGIVTSNFRKSDKSLIKPIYSSVNFLVHSHKRSTKYSRTAIRGEVGEPSSKQEVYRTSLRGQVWEYVLCRQYIGL